MATETVAEYFAETKSVVNQCIKAHKEYVEAFVKRNKLNSAYYNAESKLRNATTPAQIKSAESLCRKSEKALNTAESDYKSKKLEYRFHRDDVDYRLKEIKKHRLYQEFLRYIGMSSPTLRKKTGLADSLNSF